MIGAVKYWCALALLYAGFVHAEPNARQWLERMSKAAHFYNYEGVIVYGNPVYWDSFSIRHGYIDGVEHEYLQQLTGIPMELLRRGDEIRCYHRDAHDKHHISFKNPLHTVVPHEDLDRYYDFLLGDTQRIAGRNARQIVVLPKDEYRYGMSLWLDEETALLLQSDLVNSKRHVLERAQFAQVSIGIPLEPKDFTSTFMTHAHGIATVQDNDQVVSWKPSWLPVGFKQMDSKENAGAVRLIYSDGLATVSVFIDEIHGDYPEIHQQWGATNAVVRRVNNADGGRRVTAVGEVPLNTLLQIIMSVKLNHSDRSHVITDAQ